MVSKSRREKARRVGQTLDQLPTEMRLHIAELGFSTIDAYTDWCRRHHFSHRLRKTAIERDREARYAQRVRVEERARTGRRVRNPKATTRRLLRGERRASDRGFERFAAELSRNAGDGRQDLLQTLLRRLIAVAPELLEPDEERFAVLAHMLDHWQDQCRDPGVWRPRTHNVERMLDSLLRHCFVEFEPPKALELSWPVDGDEAARYRTWFVALARGRSMRSLDLPIPYTRRMAHWFVHAPEGLGPSAALRYGQVRGLDGSDALARAVCRTRLGHSFEHDDFWRSVLAFFARHDFECRYEVARIVDYLHDQRFVGAAYVDVYGQRRWLPPPQPNLTVAGRDPAALRRQSDEWYRRFVYTIDPSNCKQTWEPGDAGGYREEQDLDDRRQTWAVVELCSGAELRHEGQVMGHCVYTYTHDCVGGQSRIFSVRVIRHGKVEHAATVECWRGKICQVRGRHNARVPDEVEQAVRRWAEHADLPIGSHAW